MFLGYGQFANLISILITKKKVQSYFKNRLIVIDEIHNIRNSETLTNKKVASNLEILVNSIKEPIKFLFLSG